MISFFLALRLTDLQIQYDSPTHILHRVGSFARGQMKGAGAEPQDGFRRCRINAAFQGGLIWNSKSATVSREAGISRSIRQGRGGWRIPTRLDNWVLLRLGFATAALRQFSSSPKNGSNCELEIENLLCAILPAYTPTRRPVESPWRSMPSTPILSAMLRNRFVSGAGSDLR